MKIIWQPNPLYTTIELDDNDHKILRLKLHIESLEELLGSAAYASQEGDHFDLEKVRLCVKYETWDEDALTPEIDRRLGYTIGALTEEKHCGDCTCVPTSCTKCWAEALLGVDTIEGCGKHSLYKIDSAFGGNNDESISVQEAIDKLKAYEPKAEWKGWEEHAFRWKTEAYRAAIWLERYKERIEHAQSN